MEKQADYGPKWTLFKHLQSKGIFYEPIRRKLNITSQALGNKIDNVELFNLGELILLSEHLNIELCEFVKKLSDSIKLEDTQTLNVDLIPKENSVLNDMSTTAPENIEVVDDDFDIDAFEEKMWSVVETVDDKLRMDGHALYYFDHDDRELTVFLRVTPIGIIGVVSEYDEETSELVYLGACRRGEEKAFIAFEKPYRGYDLEDNDFFDSAFEEAIKIFSK